MRIVNPKGNYSFVKGISPYSAGVAASRGYAIEHARLHPAPPQRAGFGAVERHLKSLGRPRQALCAMELRSPRPFTFQGFADFSFKRKERVPVEGSRSASRTFFFVFCRWIWKARLQASVLAPQEALPSSRMASSLPSPSPIAATFTRPASIRK